MAKQQTSLSQWLVSGAPPCKKAKVDSNTEDHHSLSEPSGSQLELPGRSLLLTTAKLLMSVAIVN